MSNNQDYLTKLDPDGIHITTRPYLEKVIAHTEPYDVDVFGKPITVFPGVMSPKYDWAGLFMIDAIPHDFSGLDVLELGAGSGLVSVFVGLRGARSVTATDVNPIAVENTRFNLEKFAIPNALALLSDVFTQVPPRKFDSIIFNLPYHDGIPANDLEKGVIDADYNALTKFFAGVGAFLRDDGMMYVGFSRSGNIKRFRAEMEKNGYEACTMVEKNTWDNARYTGPDFHYNCQVYGLRQKS